MSFPNTRHTLIYRITRQGAEDDWKQFLSDYWRPLCRFAARWGRLNLDDAEDVAATTIEAVIRNDLLARWVSNRRAKLRTLLCSVSRNVLAQRARKRASETKYLNDQREQWNELAPPDSVGRLDVSSDQVDAFYEAWAEELLQSAVESLLEDYHREERGDYFRVLYGRICECMSMPEISESLGIKLTSAENYFKHARNRLQAKLNELVRQNVLRYTAPEDADSEFAAEWSRLGAFLDGRGGLDEAVRRSYDEFDSAEIKRRQNASMTLILTNVRSFLDGERDESDD